MKRNKHIAPLAAVVIMAAAMLGACSSSKKAAGGKNQGTPGIEVAPVSSPAVVISGLAQSYGEWTDVSMPVKVNLLEPKYMSVSGKAVMVRDKEIYISLRVLGFEAGGIYIDSDSVFVYEKLHKIMLAEPMSRISRATGLTLGDIQDAILGRVFVSGEGTLDVSSVKRFRLTATDGLIAMSPDKKQKNFAWLFNVTDSERPSLRSLTVDAAGRATLDCTYTQAIETAAGAVAPDMTVDAVYGKRKVRAGLDWSLSKAQWNTGAETRWKKPRGYTRLDFNKIIKMLGKE